MKTEKKSILGIGNALTDILAVLPDDSFLKMYHLPKGSMQFVDMETGNRIFESLKPYGLHYVAGGSAADTITRAAPLFSSEHNHLRSHFRYAVRFHRKSR
ncbi:putative uncharacterized protein [Bacteroides sp. CAG:770]|nr:putative uncharacterized protein [Bacteroides sp. CAG:770]